MATKDIQHRPQTTAPVVEKTYAWPTVTPPVDILEEAEGFVLRADVPGADPASINVHFERDVLTVRADRPADKIEADTVYTEHQPCSFERTFTVSNAVNADKIHAAYTNGVLTVTLPKAEAAKPRKITIKTA
jgi:HSP20 family protein